MSEGVLVLTRDAGKTRGDFECRFYNALMLRDTDTVTESREAPVPSHWSQKSSACIRFVYSCLMGR